jgi:oligopeptide/dipeptide ABC transporter ATP-binding protein
VLIADEPTTALDVTVQDQILRLIQELQEELGLAVLLVSHDLGVIAQTCDRVAVMYAGQVVEQAGVYDLFMHPQHPYTAALLGSIPSLQASADKMVTIPGAVPVPHAWPTGCRFHPRCAHAVARCSTDRPELAPVQGEDDARVRCLLSRDLTLAGVR